MEKNFIFLDSYKLLIKQIISELSSNNIILLYGKPGTGKTTLCNYMKKEGLFKSIAKEILYFYSIQEYISYNEKSKSGALIIIDNFDEHKENNYLLVNIATENKLLLISRTNQLSIQHVSIEFGQLSNSDAIKFMHKISHISDKDLLKKLAMLAENNVAWMELLSNISNNQDDLNLYISSLGDSISDLSLGKSSADTILKLYVYTANKSQNDGRYKEAENWYRMALELALNNRLNSYVISLSIALSNLLILQGKFYEAYNVLLMSLDYINNYMGTTNEELALLYYNLGQISQHINNFDNALLYYTSALEHNKKAEDTLLTAQIYNNIGSIYRESDFDKALEFYNKALHIKLSLLGENNNQIAYSYNNIASIFRKKKDYDTAIHLYEKGLESIHSSASEENNKLYKAILNNMNKVLDEQKLMSQI